MLYIGKLLNEICLYCIQLTLIVNDGKPLVFVTLEAETEEVNHMITHIGVAIKQIFLHSPIE